MFVGVVWLSILAECSLCGRSLKGREREGRKGSLPLSNLSPFLPPPLLVPATHTNGEGPPRFMAGTRGEGEKRKEETKGRKKGSDPSPLTLFSPSPPPILMVREHPNLQQGLKGRERERKTKRRKRIEIKFISILFNI